MKWHRTDLTQLLLEYIFVCKNLSDFTITALPNLSYTFYTQERNDFSKHPSLSTEDLIILFEAEKEAVKYLIEIKNHTKSKLNQVIDKYLNLIDYDM